MTELLLPAIPLSDHSALIDAQQRSPISSRLSRIRAFDLASKEATGLPNNLSSTTTTPVLAKHILDGDVPTTAFSSRLDFGDDTSSPLLPINLFLNKNDIVAQVDDKVAKMMHMHFKLLTRKSWGASSPKRSSCSPSGLGLSQWKESPPHAHAEEADDETDSGHPPPHPLNIHPHCHSYQLVILPNWPTERAAGATRCRFRSLGFSPIFFFTLVLIQTSYFSDTIAIFQTRSRFFPLLGHFLLSKRYFEPLLTSIEEIFRYDGM